MDAVEFFKTVNRLCKNQSCRKCPVCKESVCMARHMVGFNDDLIKSIEETVSKVEQWEKEHPVKTRQSEFLKMFPNASIDGDDGVLNIRPCRVDENIGCGVAEKSCDECRCEYWLAEVTDND